ncbi:xylose isomerase [Croceicoccus estronivorus]|uniref:sugar phosphate isomerase/epimerase family protein n=1 Tax=Croceicoccus estronivorus TaxID=1172626 RepID=UPI00082E4C12|nr:sugar phosphate isomerase/epimerase [Croceicoccus estronivorus]OCC25523.1 xylose isomerase [Croceicoccus estronivorus]
MLGPNDLALSAPPFGHVPLLDRLAPARDAGFTAIAVMPGDIWALEEQGMTAAEVGQRIADHGLGISEVDCTACWLPNQRKLEPTDDMGRLLGSLTPERVIETAARVGARSVTAVEISRIPVDADEAVEAFAAMCDMAAPHGIKIHIEFLPVGGIPDLQSAWRIVEGAGRPNGGLTIDSWHFFRSGSTLEQLAQIPGDRIHTVQINDAPAVPQSDLWNELMTGRLLPGEGSLDLIGLIRTLDAIGSTAPIAVEVFSDKLASQSTAAAVRTLAEAGAAIIRQARTGQ